MTLKWLALQSSNDIPYTTKSELLRPVYLLKIVD